MNKKNMMLILVLLLAIGFASISTTLVITGIAGISSKQSDFDVLFTKAKLDGVNKNEFITGNKKQTINFTSNKLTNITDTTTLEYEVTNKSRLYDAEVRITCNLVNDSDETITSEYITMDYEPKSMTVVAGTSETGSITATLKKTSTTEKDIKVKCELKATPIERTSLGAEYKAIVMPTGTELISDANKNDILDVGDEIAIGEEHFYVISHTATELNALAKYNLNVGDKRNKDETEGIQHETVMGWTGNDETSYGGVAFSNNYGWPHSDNDTIHIEDYNGPIKDALYGENGYEKYIRKTISNAQVRLITVAELSRLGCVYYQNSCGNAPKWVYSTFYWTQSAVSSYLNVVWRVHINSGLRGETYYTNTYYGVRPVVTIPLS